MPYATALTSLEDSRVLPIDQNSARFWGRIAYDDHYGGFALESDEGLRMAEALGDKPILFLKNHGVIVTGRSVAEAFDELLSGDGLPAAGHGLLHGPPRHDLRQPGRAGRGRMGGV